MRAKKKTLSLPLFFPSTHASEALHLPIKPMVFKATGFWQRGIRIETKKACCGDSSFAVVEKKKGHTLHSFSLSLTWIGVGLAYPNAAVALTNGRDRRSASNEAAANAVPSGARANRPPPPAAAAAADARDARRSVAASATSSASESEAEAEGAVAAARRVGGVVGAAAAGASMSHSSSLLPASESASSSSDASVPLSSDAASLSPSPSDDDSSSVSPGSRSSDSSPSLLLPFSSASTAIRLGRRDARRDSILAARDVPPSPSVRAVAREAGCVVGLSGVLESSERYKRTSWRAVERGHRGQHA